MRLKELIDFIESIAPTAYQEDYDNSGLQVGDEETDISGVLVTLDVTEDIVTEAIKEGYNVILAHHPIIFKGLKRLTGRNGIERVVMRAIQHNIAIYVLHTNFDNAAYGLNFHLGKLLGIERPTVLLPKKGSMMKIVTFCPDEDCDRIREAMFSAGGGGVGNYDKCSFNTEGVGTFRPLAGSSPHIGKAGELHSGKEVKVEMVIPAYKASKVVQAMIKAHPYEEVAYDLFSLQNNDPFVGSGAWGELSEEISVSTFLQQINTLLQAEGIRYTKGGGERKIKRVGACGGSGSFLIERAIALKLDVLVTADIKYHQFLDYGEQIVLVDAGHFETEIIMASVISALIQKKFTNFACSISEKIRNPVLYYK